LEEAIVEGYKSRLATLIQRGIAFMVMFVTFHRLSRRSQGGGRLRANNRMHSVAAVFFSAYSAFFERAVKSNKWDSDTSKTIHFFIGI